MRLNHPTSRRRRRRTGAFLFGVLAGGTLISCGGGSDGGTPSLTWYINPDSGGQVAIAKSCTDASGGQYRIKTSILPNDASAQRDQLVRRLAAKDDSIDIMSLDPVFVAEFSEAGFLRPFTADEATQFTDGIVQGAIDGATWNDQLYGAPFWANTQLLWYRKSVAEQAGLDMTQPVTWDQIIDAAQSTGKTVATQANRYEGYVVWINALIEGAGGQIITNPGAPADEIELGLDSEAGADAATIIRKLARSSAAGPSLSTEAEEPARALFQGGSGGFMVNWPYVWDAAGEQGSQALLDDIGWARYPQTVAGTDSKPPLGGINLGIGAYGKHQTEALAAVQCITSEANQKEYMITNGNPAARSSVYTDPAVLEAFPMAAVIQESLDAAGPRPQSQYYGDISSALQRTWHPPSNVNPTSTPKSATDLINKVLKGEVLL